MTQTDAEIVEEARRQAQESIDRFLQSMDEGKDLDECWGSVGLPTARVTIIAEDVRELGHFDLVYPPKFRGITHPRHWVYQAKRGPDTVYVLHLPNRTLLRQRGYAQTVSFVRDGSEEN